jgi:hypothetical protein
MQDLSFYLPTDQVIAVINKNYLLGQGEKKAYVFLLITMTNHPAKVYRTRFWPVHQEGNNSFYQI